MKFLTLEGVDGAGKSTHIEFIADAVRTKSAHVIDASADAAAVRKQIKSALQGL